MNRNKIKMNKYLLIVLAFLLFNIGYGQKTWTGATSTAWDTDSNWSPVGKPTSTENVLITNSANQPVISITGAACATLTLSNSAPGTTVVLTVKTSTTGTFSPTSIIMNSSGGSTSICSLNINTGRVVTGNVTMNPLQNNVTFSDDGTLFVGGTMTGGTLNANDKGTVNYSGSGTRDVGTYSYNDLTISGSGTRTIASGVIVNGTFTMGGSAKASAAPTYGVNASLLYNSTSALTVGPEWVNPFIATGGIEISNPTLDPGASVVTINDGLAKMLGEGIPLVIDEEATLVTNGDIYLEGDFINNRGYLKTDGYVYLAGNKNQSIDSFTAAKGVVMNKTGGVAIFTEDITSKELIINGQGTLNLGVGRTHAFTNWTRTQGILDGGSSILKFSGNVIGTGGNFIAGTGTVDFNGGIQNLGTGSLTYNNLTLSGSGIKTFGAKTTINETISIALGVIADLTTNLVHSAKYIKLGGGDGSGGSWGSSLSNAANKNNTYFVSTNNGIINVGPTIVINTNNLQGFTTTYGTPSASKSFDIASIAMLGGILVTPTSEFEVSIDGTNFSNTVTLGTSGAIASKTVYIRLKATTAAGSYPFGNVTLTSNGTTTINVPIALSTVDKAELTIKADNKEKFYGSLNPVLTLSYNGFVNGETLDILTKLPTITTTAVEGSPVLGSPYPITASGAEALNYKFKYEPTNGSLVIKPVALTITTNDASKVYGSLNPDFTATYVGFVNGDNETKLATKPTIATSADIKSQVGKYEITASGAVSPNYEISYGTPNGFLTITPAKLAITTNDVSKVYGSLNPDFTATYVGFVNGDNETKLNTKATIATAADTTSPVGKYEITANGAVSANYEISYGTPNGFLTVTPAKLTITTNDVSKVYGSLNPDFTVTYVGFVNGDNETKLNTKTTIVTAADITSSVGKYEITASGAVSPNYEISYGKPNGFLTITPAKLIIKADDKKREHGIANPELTVVYTGFVNGDNVASLSTPATVETTAKKESPVGEYDIIVSGAISSNYTIAFEKGILTVIKSSNADLSDIVISNGSLDKPFDTDTKGYKVEVPNEINSYVINPIPVDPNATVEMKIDGKVIDPNAPFDLKVGDNEITIVVTAEDGVTQEIYTVVVTREAAPLSNDSGLTDLAISKGILSPAFAEGTTAYTDIVPNDVTGITVTPIVADPTATITVNGKPVPSGTASENLPLKVGDNPITTVVTAQDGTITTYTVIVTREAAPLSNDSGLTDLVISKGTLSPAFAEGTTTYTDTVPNDVTGITVTPITADPTATITVNGKPVPSGTASENLPLKVGDNLITTVVTAQDGTITTYTVIVTREAAPLSNDSGLTDLVISKGTLSPAFAEGTTAYTATVPNDVAGITVTPITADPTATITINGKLVPSGTTSANLPLEVGENIITTVVTAQDGTVTTYTVVVRREAVSAPDNAGLSDIVVSDGSLDKPFNTDTKGYEVDVPNETNSIVITPKTIDPDATVVMTVDGKVIDPTAPIDLKVGDNEVTIVVTAPDGTTDTYIVIVNRADAVLQPIVPTNIITPNGDGKNDNWIVPGLDQYPNNSVKVFDRAARLVYSKNNYNNEWDGTYKGSPLNEDTYYYLIDLGNGSPKIKGFITIIRDNN